MRTPSQTVGPYYAIGLCRRRENELVPPGDPAALELTGQLLDGAGLPVPDGLVELWDGPNRRWGRCGTDGEGRFTFVVGRDADHLDVLVFARGLLRHLVTRVYLGVADQPLPESLVATEAGGGKRFDIHLQGEEETVFFSV